MKEQKSATQRLLRNDVIFISALLALAATLLIYLFVFRESGERVEVTVDGQVYGIYSLSENRTEEIRQEGEEVNRLVILDGKAYMESASCPDGICVAHPPVFRQGESIVCLPNRVVVSVISDDDGDGPDVVA